MKQKIVIISAIFLLLTLIAFMVKDFFFGKTENTNPYEFELSSVRTGDTTMAAYTETASFSTSLSEIHGLATDAQGMIYVSGTDGVEIFDSVGKMLKKFNISGTALSMAVGENGKLFIGLPDHVELFETSGKLLASWKSFGPDAVLTSIAVKGNDVFVADAGQKVVYHCDLKGNVLNKIGLKDPAAGIPGFVVPSPYFDLAIASDGGLWVVNPGRHSFEKYSSDGTLQTSWSKASMAMEGFCGCCNPSNFAFLNDSMFVTSEKGIERVKIYSIDGRFLGIVATPDQFDEGTTGLDLAVDRQNRILVLDPAKMKVRIFEPKK